MSHVVSQTARRKGLSLIIKQVLTGCTILERTLVLVFDNIDQLKQFRKDNDI